MPRRVGKSACDPFEVCEHTITALVMQAIKGVTEELAVIHHEIPEGGRRMAGPMEAFLERFQLRCRGAIRRYSYSRD
jgi:hypothetical protein